MKQFVPALLFVGAILVLVGSAVYITRWIYSPYIYTIGACMVALAQVSSPSPVKTFAVKRLYRQQIIGSLLLIVAGAFMFTTHGNEWIICLTIAAVIELYTSIRIPQEEKKQQL